MMILNQVLLGVIFLIISFLSFTIPGTFFLKKIKLNLDDGLERFTLASVFGFVLFTLFAYILAALHLRFLMYLFPILGLFSLLLKRKDLDFRFKISYKKIFLLVFFVGILGQVAVNAFSGLPYEKGIYFYSSHGHDGVWHLGLMEEMKKNKFPFENPELAGQKLQNYHFFVDLLMSEMARLFHFSNLDIYFRFMPTVFSILLGLSSFIFVRAWSKSEIAGIWGMFFTYFAGSFGYLLYIPTHKSLGGESIFWLSQTQSVLGNPPHGSAFIIVTIFLFGLLKFLNSYKTSYLIFCALLGGAVIEFKVYGGVLILGGLMFIGIFELIFKKIYKTLILFFITLLIALGIYLPNSANSTDFLIWQPWWYIRTMVVASDRLNWLDLELRRQTYIAEHNFKRVIQLETTAFLIFLFGNLGMRFLGFLTIFKQIKENIFKHSFNLFFLLITTASFLIPVFFLQKGVAWNSIQFNQYFLLFFGFLAALSIPNVLNISKNILWKTIITLIIVVLAIPTQAGLLWQFYSNKPLSKISYEELKALNFLKSKKEDAIILTAPFNKYESAKFKDPPIPIYSWYDTGYIPAFSSDRSLITDEEQVNIMGYDVSYLKDFRKEAFESSDPQIMNEFIEKYPVDYIYLAWDQKFATDEATLNIDKVFENSDAKIYKVRR